MAVMQGRLIFEICHSGKDDGIRALDGKPEEGGTMSMLHAAMFVPQIYDADNVTRYAVRMRCLNDKMLKTQAAFS